MSARKYAKQRETEKSLAEQKRMRDLMVFYCDAPDCKGAYFDPQKIDHLQHKCGGDAFQRGRRRNTK